MEAGDEDAQLNHAVTYETSDGVAVDIVKAAYWYTLAAEADGVDVKNMAQAFLDHIHHHHPQ